MDKCDSRGVECQETLFTQVRSRLYRKRPGFNIQGKRTMSNKAGRPRMKGRDRRSVQAWGRITEDLFQHCETYARERRRSFSSLVEEGLATVTRYKWPPQADRTA